MSRWLLYQCTHADVTVSRSAMCPGVRGGTVIQARRCAKSLVRMMSGSLHTRRESGRTLSLGTFRCPATPCGGPGDPKAARVELDRWLVLPRLHSGVVGSGPIYLVQATRAWSLGLAGFLLALIDVAVLSDYLIGGLTAATSRWSTLAELEGVPVSFE